MSQFQNETFQFDFVKCLVQILRQSVANLWTTQFSLHSHKTWGGIWVVIAISSCKMYAIMLK